MKSTDMIVLLILVLILFFGIKETVKHFKGEGGCCGGAAQEKKLKARDRNKRHYPYMAEIGVEGMHCDGCKTRVENAFHKLDGYMASADVSQKKVTVRMKQVQSEDTLREIIKNSGYRVVSVHLQ